MNNPADPISQIKKAEEELKKKVEQAKIDFDKKEKEYAEILEKKASDFKNELREKGIEKLQTTKKEAGELFKSDMATAESEKNKAITTAKEKFSGTTQEIISTFLNHIKQ